MKIALLSISIIVLLTGLYLVVSPKINSPIVEEEYPTPIPPIDISSSTTSEAVVEDVNIELGISNSSITKNATGLNTSNTDPGLSICGDLKTIASKYDKYSVPVKIAFGIASATEGIDDSDGDCLLDSFEIETCFSYCNPAKAFDDFGMNEFLADYDKDGLTNGEEQTYGTSPLDPDADHDNLDDKAEIKLKSNPKLADTDSDGIIDGTEVLYKLNPLVADANTYGTYPATWILDERLIITFYIKDKALEVVNFKKSFGNFWEPHNHVSWRRYSLDAIDYSFYFEKPMVVEKVVIKNPPGEMFHPIYFSDSSSEDEIDFWDMVAAKSSTVDEVTAEGNVHYINGSVRSFGLTDNFNQFQIEEQMILNDL